MGLTGTVAALLIGVLTVAGPAANVASEQQLDPSYDQGLARSPSGWVVSGRNVLALLNDRLEDQIRLDAAIPPDWRDRGFDHIGDIDLSGTTLYVPFEQPDYEEGRQAMARFDAQTLAFRDATVVEQHENSFVAVDGGSGIAYSMDRVGGAALLRYDVRSDWRPLTPLRLDRTLERVQGAAVARDAIWLATDDDENGMYRVDIETGAVTGLGSAPPVDGGGEGIDASEVRGENLHTTVVDSGRLAVTLDHFQVTGEPVATAASGPSARNESPTSWPPALTYFAIGLALAVLGAVGTILWRAHTTLRPRR